MKLSSIAILLGAAVAAAPSVVVYAESLRGNYLQADAFFANPEDRDCEGRGVRSCGRLPQCAQVLDSSGNAVTNSCLEFVNRCSEATRTICQNAVQMSSSSSRSPQNLALCEWSGGSRFGRCSVAQNRRGGRQTVSVIQSRQAVPRTRPAAYIEEDDTDFSEDYE